MPRIISDKDIPHVDVSHTDTSTSTSTEHEPAHDHTSLDENQSFYPKGGLKKHHDHTTQHQMELYEWAKQHNSKAQTGIQPQEQSSAMCGSSESRFVHPRGIKHGFPGSGKTISKKHKFIRDPDQRQSKNQNTRSRCWINGMVVSHPNLLDQSEDEQEQGSTPDVKQEEGARDRGSDEEEEEEYQDDDDEEIEESFRQQLNTDVRDKSMANIITPSDTYTFPSPSATTRHLSVQERRELIRRRQQEQQQEQQRKQQADVQKPQLAIPQPIIVRADDNEDEPKQQQDLEDETQRSQLPDASAPEKAMGMNITGMTSDEATRGDKQISNRM